VNKLISTLPNMAFANSAITRLPLTRLPLRIRSHALTILPNILRPALSFFPFSAQKSLLLRSLNTLFKEAMEDGDFDFLENKWLRISVIDLGLNWWLSFEQNALVMASSNNKITEDVSFSANGDDLLLIAGRKEDPDTLFFQRKLKIEGDTELGLEVKNLIDAIDLDELPNSIQPLIEYFSSILLQTRKEMEKNEHDQIA